MASAADSLCCPPSTSDDQQSLAANKIADVIANRLLSNKLVPIDLPIANPIPENRFRIGLIETQAPGDAR